jgi:hypothetical protein
MDEAALVRLLEEVRSGARSADEAVDVLRRLPFADLGFAKVDHHRSLRQRLPEAVYAQGKTADECTAIVGELLAGPLPGSVTTATTSALTTTSAATVALADGGPGAPVILTRADPAQVARCLADHPDGAVAETGAPTGTDRRPGPLATVVWRPAPARDGRALVLTAGTSDLPVARECAATLDALGVGARVVADCGVAGIHRLLAAADDLAEADARGRGAHQHRVRRRARRGHRPAGHAGLVCRRSDRRRDRQRVRRRLCRLPPPPVNAGAGR